MNKAYNKITWQNKPSTATPLNQTNLNEMSNALDTIDDRVIALDSGKVSSVTVTNTLPTGDTIATITVDGTATNIKSAQVVVDAEPSATSANPLQNKAIYEMLNNLLPEETVQGNPIAISDASGLNAKACSVDLLPIQDLHGYDSPWVGGAGKNRVPMTVSEIKASNTGGTWSGNVYTYNGITFTILVDNDNNVIGFNVNGTSNERSLLFCGRGIYKAGNYAINGCPSGGSGGTYQLRADIFESPVRYSTDTGSGNTFTLASDTDVRCTIDVKENKSVPNVTYYPMIRLATVSDATFEPYENKCSISGRSELNLADSGKNIIDVSNPTYSNKTLDAYGNLTNSNYYDTWEFKGGVKYAFNLTKGSGFDILRYALFVNGVGTRYTRTTFPFTIDATNSSIVRITLGKTDFATNVQLEIGEQSTAYEPYQGETVTVQFGQTVYGGTLDVTNGKLTIDTKITDMGDLSYNYNSQYNTFATGVVSDMADMISDKVQLTCSALNGITPKSATAMATVDDNTIAFNSNASLKFFRIKCTAYTDADVFKTAMTGQKIVYKIATPIELTLTAEQISLLKGNNVVSTDGDSINLVYSADIKAWVENQLQS